MGIKYKTSIISLLLISLCNVSVSADTVSYKDKIGK